MHSGGGPHQPGQVGACGQRKRVGAADDPQTAALVVAAEDQRDGRRKGVDAFRGLVAVLAPRDFRSATSPGPLRGSPPVPPARTRLTEKGLPKMTTVPAQPGSARQSVLLRYPLVCFFVMAYAFTWIVTSPWTLGATGAGLLPVDLSVHASGLLLAAGILAGPTLAAIIMTAAKVMSFGVGALLVAADGGRARA
jgi:hypothetical protein